MSEPLQVGDIVRVKIAFPAQPLPQPNTYTGWYHNQTNPSANNWTYQLQTTVTLSNSSNNSQYSNFSTKQPPLGAVLVITGILQNETYPLEARDLETGEEYEIYRYQIARDDFMTAVRRRRERTQALYEYAKSEALAAITPASECAPRPELLLEAAE